LSCDEIMGPAEYETEPRRAAVLATEWMRMRAEVGRAALLAIEWTTMTGKRMTDDTDHLGRIDGDGAGVCCDAGHGDSGGRLLRDSS
jgi:sugar phosphate isomerase/epimerase